LGLIVIDEEHEWSYKQEKTPRYHARDVAIKVAELTGAKVVLGSATPDLGTYYRAERGDYHLLTLPQRIMGHRKGLEEQKAKYAIPDTRYAVRELEEGYEAQYMDLPPVQVVDLRQELRAGNRGIFSRALKKAMREALAAGEQVILFLNRRGAATFVMCRDCGHVIKCPRCQVPLTYHSAGEDLVCHHCNRRTRPPTVCPQCQSKRIRYFGIGTQRVEEVVERLFRQARTIRWDRDTTGRKGAHEAILERFISRQADVMVGTQMVAKGLDLPLVTLVGVVTADTALHLPDFRAGERTFQLLTQVAGRAGRSILGGKVIVQTYTPNHYAIQAASGHDYEAFYRQELAFRREQGYPPYKRLVRLIRVGRSYKRCQEDAERLYRVLENKIARLGLPGVDLIGPAPAFHARLRGNYRWHIIVRAQDPYPLLEDMPLPRGWRVDVDPVSVL
jgi:primosomal protein N' (replication factor Y)